MSDVRIVALHRAERELAAAYLREAVVKDEAERELLNDVAEMLLKAKRADEFGGLSDA